MHIIRKLRLSVTHRPRHLFDLPDEILQQILAYCCEDLSFLLWSCPSRASHNLVGFCHECSYCSQCHLLAQQQARQVTLRHRLRYAERLSKRSLSPTTATIDIATGIPATATASTISTTTTIDSVASITTTPPSPKVSNDHGRKLALLPPQSSTLLARSSSSSSPPTSTTICSSSSLGGTDSILYVDNEERRIHELRRQRRQRRRQLHWQRAYNALNPTQSFPPPPPKRNPFGLLLSWFFSDASNRNGSNRNGTLRSSSNVQFQFQRSQPYAQRLRQRNFLSPWSSSNQARFQEFLAFLERLQLTSQGWAWWTSWWKRGKLLNEQQPPGQYQQHHSPTWRSRPLRSLSAQQRSVHSYGTSSSVSRQSLRRSQHLNSQQQSRRRRPHNETTTIRSPHGSAHTRLAPTSPSITTTTSFSSTSQQQLHDSPAQDSRASTCSRTIASSTSGAHVSMHEGALYHLRDINSGRVDMCEPHGNLNSIFDDCDINSDHDNQYSGDECEDDYASDWSGSDSEDEILLSGPVNLLLVSKRFADAAVCSLWQNLVFHGHDPVQMEALLRTLDKDDSSTDEEEGCGGDFLAEGSIYQNASTNGQQQQIQSEDLDRWEGELGQHNIGGPCAALQKSSLPATLLPAPSTETTMTLPPLASLSSIPDSTDTVPAGTLTTMPTTTLSVINSTATGERGEVLHDQSTPKGALVYKETGDDATGTMSVAAVECTMGFFDACGTSSCPTSTLSSHQNNNTMKQRAVSLGYNQQGVAPSTVCLDPAFVSASASASISAATANNLGDSSRATRPLNPPSPEAENPSEISSQPHLGDFKHSVLSDSITPLSSSTNNAKGKERLQHKTIVEASSDQPSVPLLSARRSRLRNKSRWPYRRYVRRLVLNFAHPQASAQHLVDVLECINRWCPNQIQALDLHANEKMRAAGLEKTLELERLFSTGFTNLRYLRLQGGFVDNRLLSALLKSMRPPTSSSEHSSGQRVAGNLASLPPLVSNQSGKSTAPTYATKIPAAIPRLQPCRLSQVFLGPGSVTDSAVEKLVDVAGHSLEVFRVMSCVDVGGSTLATLLTRCPKLRVLGMCRSLARDRDLLEGLGIELDDGFPTSSTSTLGPPLATPGSLSSMGGLTAALSALSNAVNIPSSTTQQALSNTATINYSHLGGNLAASNHIQPNSAGGERHLPFKPTPKKIIAPLERLELGTVKLTRRGVEEIIKGVSKTLRFLVLETQHLSEPFLQDVVMPLGVRLEALHFNKSVTVDHHHHGGFGSMGRHGTRASADSAAKQTTSKNQRKVSDWLGETTTDQWVTHGDNALWTSVFDSYFEVGGGLNQQPYIGQAPNYQQHQSHTAGASALPHHHHPHPPHQHNQPFHGREHAATFRFHAVDSDEILEQFGVRRSTIDAVLTTLPQLKAFTVMQCDFFSEKDGAWEWMQIEREEAKWVQSLGFRALQALYLFLLLSYVFLGGVNVIGVGSHHQAGGRAGNRRQS